MLIRKYKSNFAFSDLFLEKCKYYQASKSVFFNSARSAIYCWLKFQKKSCPNKKYVLLPAYICESVIDAVRIAGLEPRYYDMKRNSFLPDIQHAKSLMAEDVVAILAAPYFGFYFKEAVELRQYFSGAKILLDFAQGIGFDYQSLDADAIVFSFGIGKGIDYYGGAILSKNTDFADGFDKESLLQCFVASAKFFVFARLLRSSISYNLLSPLIEVFYKKNKHSDNILPSILHAFSKGIILKRISRVMKTIAISRERARLIYDFKEFSRFLPPKKELDFEKSVFWRIPVLPENERMKNEMLRFFRKKGIEMTEAGEDITDPELENYMSFNFRVLKLPCLGTLSEREFLHLVRTVGEYCV